MDFGTFTLRKTLCDRHNTIWQPKNVSNIQWRKYRKYQNQGTKMQNYSFVCSEIL